jgi:hypothetical protein
MSVHARLGVAVIAVAAVGALLVLLARRRPNAASIVRVFVRLCAVAAALEAVIGLALLIAGNRPTEGIHFFYGAATVLPIPAAELLAHRAGARDEMLYLLAGAVATALFGLRAVATGST